MEEWGNISLQLVTAQDTHCDFCSGTHFSISVHQMPAIHVEFMFYVNTNIYTLRNLLEIKAFECKIFAEFIGTQITAHFNPGHTYTDNITKNIHLQM